MILDASCIELWCDSHDEMWMREITNRDVQKGWHGLSKDEYERKLAEYDNENKDE